MRALHCHGAEPARPALPAEPLRDVSQRRRRTALGSIEDGLPSSFGFPAVARPRDPLTLFLLPLNGDTAGRYVPQGKAAVWRTRDGGVRWDALRNGLPQQNAFFGVLRQAMAADRLEPAGIYAGTNTGTLFASADEGESWAAIAQHLPPILSVETMIVDP